MTLLHVMLQCCETLQKGECAVYTLAAMSLNGS